MKVFVYMYNKQIDNNTMLMRPIIEEVEARNLDGKRNIV